MRLTLPLLPILAACGSFEQTPIDEHLALLLKLQRDRMNAMCAAFPALGVDALGHVPGLPMLAKGELQLTVPPTDAQLQSVGMTPTAYRKWATDMVVVDIDLVRARATGVDFLMHTERVDAGTLEVYFHCAETVPPGHVESQTVNSKGEDKGAWCAPLEEGWWACRQVR